MEPPVVQLRDPRAQALEQDAQARFAQVRQLDAEGRHEAALAVLRETAALGYVPAMTFLAGRLLTGRGAPLSVRDAVPLLRRAAGAGAADANCMMAALAAAGAGMPQDWTLALDHLERAAGQGSERACGQLRTLGGEPDEGGSWAQVRRRIDIGGWLSPPTRQVLSERPRLRIVEGFVSAAVCDWLMQRGRSLIRPAPVYDPTTGEARQGQAPTNSAAEFDIVQADVVLALVRARIAAVTHLPVLAMEPTRVLHYAVGQRFGPHYDFLDLSVEGAAREAAVRGQRIATFLLYLNDDYGAGQTSFPRLGLAHRGRKGDALFFANVDVENRPDPSTLHAGLAPTSGEKWVLSQWIRNRNPSRP